MLFDYSRTWEFFTWGFMAGFGLSWIIYFFGLYSGIGFRWFRGMLPGGE